MRKLTAGPVAVGCLATIVWVGGVGAAEASYEPPPPTICVGLYPSTSAPAFNSPTQNCIGVPADFTEQFDNIRERNRSRLDSWNWIRWLIKPAIALVVVAAIGAKRLMRGRGSSGAATPWASSPPPPTTPGPPPPPPYGQSPLDSPPPPPPPTTADVMSSGGVDPAPPETPTPRPPVDS